MEMMISQPQRNLSNVPKAPKIPVIYEEAVRDLILCQSLDEAQYFVDKAEALSAWAKIYKDDQAGIESKRLKLHAYRRMGQIAGELRPRKSHRRRPGSIALLRANGLSVGAASAARKLANLDRHIFDTYVSNPRPPSPNGVLTKESELFPGWYKFYSTVISLNSICRKHTASDFAKLASGPQAATMRLHTTQLIEWLDEFERFLPKATA